MEKARKKAEEEARQKAAAEAAAKKKREEELARKKAAAEAAARENARRVAESKEREAKAKAEARAADARNREAANQRAREAEANRLAAERKAKADADRSKKEIDAAEKDMKEGIFHDDEGRSYDESGGIELNKGRLPMPITGSYRIVSRFGVNSEEGLRGVYLDNKGINIKGSDGCQARCVYDGEVRAVSQYGGLWIIIVKHGSYYSVYCNIRTPSVFRGNKVRARQTLGTVGPDNILHFQLHKGGSKLNPEAWLGR